MGCRISFVNHSVTSIGESLMCVDFICQLNPYICINMNECKFKLRSMYSDVPVLRHAL